LKKSGYKPLAVDEPFFVTTDDGAVDTTRCYAYFTFEQEHWGLYTTDERRLILEADRPGYAVGGEQPIEYSVKYLFEQRTECVQCPGLGACRWRGWQYFYEVDDDFTKIWVHSRRCKAAADENAARALAYAQKMAEVPSRYRATLLRDFDATGQAVLLTAIKSFVNERRGLWIYGTVGTGKTMVASILANACLRRRRDVRFCNVPQLLGRLRTAAAEGGTAVRDLLSATGAAAVLILDDLGAENQSAWTLEQIFGIVNDRYNGGDGQLLITSNLSPLELRRQWGAVDHQQAERICSRLAEMTLAVEIVGVDRRRSY